MKGLWIILVMAGFVLPLFARFKRTMAETTDSVGDTAHMEDDEDKDDGFFDFDLVIRDPEKKNQMLPPFNFGDGLHPGADGGRVMAEAINLTKLMK